MYVQLFSKYHTKDGFLFYLKVQCGVFSGVVKQSGNGQRGGEDGLGKAWAESHF